MLFRKNFVERDADRDIPLVESAASKHQTFGAEVMKMNEMRTVKLIDFVCYYRNGLRFTNEEL